MDAVVRALKFSRLPALSRPVADELADCVAAADTAFDLITFVPLHWTRRLTRGYDQAEEIARALAHRLDCEATGLLRRQRATRAQSRLPRAIRATNLASAFRLRKGSDPSGRRVLLVDDVITSGATLGAAARCLKSAGAVTVTAVVAARTPLPGEQVTGVRDHRVILAHGIRSPIEPRAGSL